MDNYHHNLRFIDPALRMRLDNISTNHISIHSTNAGIPTLKVFGRFLHSSYDPVLEAKRLVSRLGDLKRKEVVIVLGLGLGYHVKQILTKLNPENILVIIEKDLAIFKVSMEVQDLHEVLSHPDVGLIIGDKDIGIYDRLREVITLDRIDRVRVFKHPPSTSIYKDYYSNVVNIIETIIRQQHLNLGSLTEYGQIWQENILKNLPEIINNPPVDSLFGRFKNMPAIIISAGPSLDKNVEELKRAKDRALLIAVDTVLKPLLFRGIRPDIVVSCDAQEENYIYVKGIEVEDIVLVADSICYPLIFENFKGIKLISSHGHPVMEWIQSYIERYGDLLKTTPLETGGSVATVAFDLARKAEANPIVFVGQDLSYPGERIYSKGVPSRLIDSVSRFNTLEMMNREAIRNKGVVFATDIFGKKVPTHENLLIYRDWFTNEMKKTEGLCINATEGGILKEGVKIMDLSSAIDKYCKESIDIQGLLRESLNYKPKVDIKRLKRDIKNLIIELKGIEEISQKAIKLKDLDKFEGLKGWISKLPSARFITGGIQGILWRLNKIEDGQDIDKRLEGNISLFQGINKVSKKIQALLNQVLEKL
ncbi:MAG: DUF115 domain-containing protein [bacterium]|nr:DUF115 domain-containing protein [bacterium]